ncbi:hypothetical protein NUSPORA_01183 [Nucleospora cyclopteri]
MTPTKSQEVDISWWVKEKLEEILSIMGAQIIYLEVEGYLLVKAGRAQIINNVNLKYIDKKTGKSISLENYSSSNKLYENSETKWITNQIKDLECRAFLKFGSVASGTAQKEYTEASSIKIAEPEVISKTSDLTMTLFINTSIENMKAFLTEEKFVRMWILNGSYKQDCIKFDNVIFKDMQVEKSEIKLDFKLDKWKTFVKSKITLTKSGSDTKIVVVQKDIPIEEVDGIKEQWRRRVFTTICNLFNCYIKKEQ